jgi:HEAT repeat protein
MLSPVLSLADKAIWAAVDGAIDGSERVVKTGLRTTCQVLTTSRNRAVLPVLLAGIRSSNAEVRADVIVAALRRHDHATHTQLVRHFAELDEADQAVLCEAHRAVPHHAGPVLRQAVLVGDPELCENSCEIILAANDFELLPTLLKAAENKSHPYRDNVLAAISGLADTLYHDLALWVGSDRKTGRDPSFTRHHVLHALEVSLGRFAQHQCTEILDAFLLLAPTDNNTFQKILRDQTHASHQALVHALAVSQDSAIIERLVELLRDTDAPPAAVKLIAERDDETFLNILLHELKHPVPLRVVHNMKRMRQVAWLESHRKHLLEMDGRAQFVAVDLANASGISRDSLFDLLTDLLRDGMAEGRRASCQALAKFNDEKADALVVAALKDPDASVQAAAVRQLRPRRIPDALQRLVAFLDSRSAEVRDAARSSLAEFNFIRYRSMFDLLDEESARTTGKLVHKVDATAIQKLQEDLASPSLTTRLRGIEMAIAMAAADDVLFQLTELAHHENGAVRKEAVLALGHCASGDSFKALEMATHDLVSSVAEAARQSLTLQRRQTAGSNNSTAVNTGRQS